MTHKSFKITILFLSTLLLFFVLFFAGVGVASAATYYVSPSGSDTNNGLTLSTAWKTIQHAADTVDAGDTVLVQSGTYNETVVETTSGTAANRIVFQGVDNPVIAAGGGTGFKIEGDYVTVTDFSFKNAQYGIWVYGADYATVTNNTMDDLSCSVGIAETGTVYYLTITNNTIYTKNTAISLDGDLWYANISYNTINTNTMDIETLFCHSGWRHSCNFVGNTIRGGRNGFGGLGGDHCYIAYNNISGYGHNGLNLHGDQYCIVENNWIGAGHPDNPNPNGIYIDGTTDKSFGNIYRNNTVENVASRAFAPGNAYNGTVINDIYKNSGMGVQIITAHWLDYSLQSGKWLFKNLTVENVDTYGFQIANIWSDSTDYGGYKLIDSNISGTSPYRDISFDTVQLPITLWIVNTKLSRNDISLYQSPTSKTEIYYYLDVKVVDINGNPVEGAKVTVKNIDNPSYPPINMEDTWPPTNISKTYTVSNGHTPLPNNNTGTIAIMDYLKNASGTIYYTYKITVEKDSYSNSTTVNPDSSWYRSNPDIYQNTITIVLPTTINTGNISGTVTDGTNPIEGATVSDGTRTATTAADGTYTISNVPAGTYTVTASKTGYQFSSQLGVVVEEGKTKTVDFALTAIPSIKGDLNSDGKVNSLDYSLLVAKWFQTTDIENEDINKDGIVNVRDLGIMMSNWTH